MNPSTSRMMKRRNSASGDTAVVDIFRREVGHLSTRKFAHRIAASEDLILRFELKRKLEKHRGCVNTVSFNADGDILVSGSDDTRVILWDWETGTIKLHFDSGHDNNIFQAKIMPETDERSIVTCGADGQVRHATILESGKVVTKLLGKHRGRVHKLANEPGSVHVFYTCAEDGLVQHFDLRTGEATELFSCQPVRERRYMPIVNLNAIAIDPHNPNLFAVGGSDEFTRLYDIRRYKHDASTDFGKPADYFCPKHLLGDENVGITGLAFSDQGELLVSYSEELIYLFSKNMGWGSNVSAFLDDRLSVGSDSDVKTDSQSGPRLFKGHRNCVTIKGVNFYGPKSEYVVSGSDCGRMFFWRKKDAELIRVVEADKEVVNCIQSHPHTTMLASCGIDRDIKIWTPTSFENAPPPTNIERLTPTTNSWMYHMVSARDMALQLLAIQNQEASPDQWGNADGEVNNNTLEYIITFDANNSEDDYWEDDEDYWEDDEQDTNADDYLN